MNITKLAIYKKLFGGGSGGSGGGGDIDALIDGSITEITSGAESVRKDMFKTCEALTTANFPNATSIGNYAFSDCSALTAVNFPNATSMGSYVFEECGRLTTANFPKVTSVKSSAFSRCTALTTANFPNATSVGDSAFYYCYLLTTANFPKVTSIAYGAFAACYSLKTITLRSDTVCSLGSTYCFNNCYHILGTVNATYNPEGLKDGYIYVPSALIEDYKVATNWSTYATQFRALEDYTVDGTITGELDESKI